MFVVNRALAYSRGLSDDTITEIESLQKLRDEIQDEMKSCKVEDKERLLELKSKWTDNEFELQRLWKFPSDAAYHKEFLLPHCKCPTLDNYMYVGSSTRVINKNCVYHGNSND